MARVSIEDCLTSIDNKFVLVAVASHRARKLLSGEESLIKTNNKEAVTALREIAESRVLPSFPVKQAEPTPKAKQSNSEQTNKKTSSDTALQVNAAGQAAEQSSSAEVTTTQ